MVRECRARPKVTSWGNRIGRCAAAGAALVFAGCASTAEGPAGSGAIDVRASDSSCEVAATGADAGTLTFAITNTGTKITEFYLYGTGDRIVGEMENIAPGVTRRLIVEVPDAGAYTTVCKPGMIGDGIRAPFTVTGTAPRSVDSSAVLAEATGSYHRYLVAQADALLARTQDFAAAVSSRDVVAAKALFPTARTHYERIEPVAESFGDLDPRLDGREDDQRDPGVAWTGFHRLEKELWVSGLSADAPALAAQLVADVRELQSRVGALALTPLELANGAKSLLDEVVTRKLAGEEDRYSHTDLWDLKANVEGSQGALAALRQVVDARDPALGPVLDARFASINRLLAGHEVAGGYRIYTELSSGDIKELAVAIDAAAEPVSRVAGVVTS